MKFDSTPVAVDLRALVLMYHAFVYPEFIQTTVSCCHKNFGRCANEVVS